jgi:hypothetical protein
MTSPDGVIIVHSSQRWLTKCAIEAGTRPQVHHLCSLLNEDLESQRVTEPLNPFCSKWCARDEPAHPAPRIRTSVFCICVKEGS